jgi:hypothetical protein
MRDLIIKVVRRLQSVIKQALQHKVLMLLQSEILQALPDKGIMQLQLVIMQGKHNRVQIPSLLMPVVE